MHASRCWCQSTQVGLPACQACLHATPGYRRALYRPAAWHSMETPPLPACVPAAGPTSLPHVWDAALNAAIDARPLRNESTLTELILNAPELVNPLVGYHGAGCAAGLSGRCGHSSAGPGARSAPGCHPLRCAAHAPAEPPSPCASMPLQCCRACGPPPLCSRAPRSTPPTPLTRSTGCSSPRRAPPR